jgi:hypothetical protein
MTRIINTIFLGFFLLISVSVSAQVEVLVQKCQSFLPKNYISDGQEYRTLLNQDEVGEFKAVFYGGSTYRLVVLGSNEGSQVTFTLYDQNQQELFSNRDYNNSQYWDFKFASTMVCTIETNLPMGVSSGFVVMLVGFKQ